MPVFSSQNYDLASFMNISIGFDFKLKAQGGKFQTQLHPETQIQKLCQFSLVIPLALSCFSCPIVLLSEQPPQMAGKKMAADHIKCFPLSNATKQPPLWSKCQGEAPISPA